MTLQQHFHPVHACNDGIFNAVSGQHIDLNHPTIAMFNIVDIASALSKICRFGGHSSCFYSVAQHSILVAEMCEKKYYKEALMHDAAEAYLGDVIKPLKVMLGDTYGHIEDRFERVIAKCFNLNTSKAAKEVVKKCDLLALEMEHEAFQLNNPAKFVKALVKHNLLLEDRYAWTDETAKAHFLKAFYNTSHSTI